MYLLILRILYLPLDPKQPHHLTLHHFASEQLFDDVPPHDLAVVPLPAGCEGVLHENVTGQLAEPGAERGVVALGEGGVRGGHLEEDVGKVEQKVDSDIGEEGGQREGLDGGKGRGEVGVDLEALPVGKGGGVDCEAEALQG